MPASPAGASPEQMAPRALPQCRAWGQAPASKVTKCLAMAPGQPLLSPSQPVDRPDQCFMLLIRTVARRDGVRGGGSRQWCVPEQEGLIFWRLYSLASLSSIVLPSRVSSRLWGHRGVVPPLRDAEKMLSIMWKTLLAATHRWRLAKLWALGEVGTQSRGHNHPRSFPDCAENKTGA